jgi:hypothetical protein
MTWVHYLCYNTPTEVPPGMVACLSVTCEIQKASGSFELAFLLLAVCHSSSGLQDGCSSPKHQVRAPDGKRGTGLVGKKKAVYFSGVSVL